MTEHISSLEKSEPDLKREIITEDPAFLKIIAIAKKVAKSTSSVLIRGESGTGKELLARYIHAESDRSDNRFVAVNCPALPDSLIESELFGHEKGSFTGAFARKIGKFEQADKGTLLLDEITETSIEMQGKLLRSIQEKEIERIGSRETIKVDLRFISTTNKDIEKLILEKKFREDLLFRINVVELGIPPLRQRRKDIPILVDYFIKKQKSILGFDSMKISDSALSELEQGFWKGNVRELENVIERACLLSEGDIIKIEDLMIKKEADADLVLSRQIKAGETVADLEKELILKTLEYVDNNKTEAAKMLGLSIRTLRNRLNEYKDKEIKLKNGL